MTLRRRLYSRAFIYSKSLRQSDAIDARSMRVAICLSAAETR